MALLQDKVILITGGASGIGRASALMMAGEGATVIVSDVNTTGGEETAQMIAKNGGEADSIHADVSQNTEVEMLIQTIKQRYGRLDCAVNNAGIAGKTQGRIHEFDESTFDQIIGINLKGVWLCMKHELMVMMAQKHGVIVNVASVAGLVGSVKNAAYAASKHGVVGLTRSAAGEYAKHGIRVNAICPAYTETPMVTDIFEQDAALGRLIISNNPMKRLGKAEEIASAVVWLCSDGASFVTGQALALDGGLTAL